MRITFILVVLLVYSQDVCGQKLIERNWDSHGISRLLLTTDMAYSINITTARVSQISLRARAEGETFEHVLINEKLDQDQLQLFTSYTPYYEPINDKLAAHKVMGLDVQLTLPEGMVVEVRSALASVQGQGRFLDFSARLEDGNCTLKEFKGNARLITQGGFICVSAKEGVTGKATSKHGKVLNTLAENGNYLIWAESVRGDIKLLPTQ